MKLWRLLRYLGAQSVGWDKHWKGLSIELEMMFGDHRKGPDPSNRLPYAGTVADDIATSEPKA